MPPKRSSKRTREDDDAPNRNEEIAGVFEQLRDYESKCGSGWAATAYNKVVKAIRDMKDPITSGKDVASKPGFGKASVGKIDEFLSSGKLAKLEEFKETFGPLPENMASGKPAAKGKKAASSAAKPPTKAVLKKIKDAEEEFEDKSATALKELLKSNDQVTSGTKAELVLRCAQGSVLGPLPRCPLCSAGKLRFDLKTGTYTCPGYMDDDTFHKCFFTGGDVERGTWKE